MKYVIIYWSRFGTNKKIVNTLAKKLEKKDAETKIFKTDELDPSDIPKADIYVFSAPTEAFRVQRNMRKFMKNLKGMEGKKYAIINTHSMKKNWLKSMEKYLSKKDMDMVASIDFQVGKKPEEGNALMDDWESKIKKFAEKI